MLCLVLAKRMNDIGDTLNHETMRLGGRQKDLLCEFYRCLNFIQAIADCYFFYYDRAKQ